MASNSGSLLPATSAWAFDRTGRPRGTAFLARAVIARLLRAMNTTVSEFDSGYRNRLYEKEGDPFDSARAVYRWARGAHVPRTAVFWHDGVRVELRDLLREHCPSALLMLRHPIYRSTDIEPITKRMRRRLFTELLERDDGSRTVELLVYAERKALSVDALWDAAFRRDSDESVASLLAGLLLWIRTAKSPDFPQRKRVEQVVDFLSWRLAESEWIYRGDSETFREAVRRARSLNRVTSEAAMDPLTLSSSSPDL